MARFGNDVGVVSAPDIDFSKRGVGRSQKALAEQQQRVDVSDVASTGSSGVFFGQSTRHRHHVRSVIILYVHVLPVPPRLPVLSKYATTQGSKEENAISAFQIP